MNVPRIYEVDTFRGTLLEYGFGCSDGNNLSYMRAR